jgi:hypothetical protein
MGHVLYFGGSGAEAAQRSPVVDIDSLNAWQFCTDLDHWVGAVYAVGQDAPVLAGC